MRETVNYARVSFRGWYSRHRNLGSKGWKPGRVIALNYQEENWPKEKIAPYQVILEETHTLILSLKTMNDTVEKSQKRK